MRNWYRDDPVQDAEDWTNREDPRPIVGRCEVCNCILHGGDDGYEPDDGYEVESNVFVCSDHLEEYFKDNKLK